MSRNKPAGGKRPIMTREEQEREIEKRLKELPEDCTHGPMCPRCNCCEMTWNECGNCEEGYSDHDCGEDTCCCLDPQPNVVCDMCNGKGGFWACDCNQYGKHGEDYYEKE